MLPAQGGGRDITGRLAALREGRASAWNELLPLVHDELHRLARAYMRRERADHTLQPTALLHEAFIRLFDQTHVEITDRLHFYRLAARTMRNVLVDHARTRGAGKRGAAVLTRLGDDEIAEAAASEANTVDLLALNDALERLAAVDETQAQVVELRFFAGLTVGETAAALGISERTVHREWGMARAFIRRHLHAS
jgi:RNA polymerase sigma factor (TIGR02999 family)